MKSFINSALIITTLLWWWNAIAWEIEKSALEQVFKPENVAEYNNWQRTNEEKEKFLKKMRWVLNAWNVCDINLTAVPAWFTLLPAVDAITCDTKQAVETRLIGVSEASYAEAL